MTLARDSELRLLLVDGNADEFNEKAGENPPDLERAWLRGVDLREADLSHANLRGAHLRGAARAGTDSRAAALSRDTLQGVTRTALPGPRVTSSG